MISKILKGYPLCGVQVNGLGATYKNALWESELGVGVSYGLEHDMQLRHVPFFFFPL